MKIANFKEIPFVLILAMAFLLRLICVFTSEGLNHADELFQVLEPAHGLVYGYSLKTWEWVEGIRSYGLPYFYAGIMKLGQVLFALDHPRSVMVFLRFFTGLLSLLSVVGIYKIGRKLSEGPLTATLAAALMAVWWTSLYFSVRTMSEPLCLNFLLIGTALAYQSWSGPESGKRFYAFAAGLVLGLAFWIRFQTGLWTLGLSFSYFYYRRFSLWGFFAAGVLLMVFFQGLIDLFTWDSFLQSPLKYLQWNFFDGGATRVFGHNPWHRYLTALIRYLTLPGALIMVFFSLRTLWVPALRHRSLPLWFGLGLFWGVHQLVGHKEDRFILPMLPILYLTFALGLEHFFQNPLHPLKRKIVPLVIALALILGNLYKIRKWEWNYYKDVVDTFLTLHENSAVTGVLVYAEEISHTGGYFYLHRNIPLEFIPASATIPLDRKILEMASRSGTVILSFKEPLPLIARLSSHSLDCSSTTKVSPYFLFCKRK